MISFDYRWWPLKGPVGVSLLLRNILSLGSLLGQENSLDVGDDSTLGNSNSGEQLVHLTDGKLEVTGLILVFLMSQAAMPANSRTSAARYSMTAAM